MTRIKVVKTLIATLMAAVVLGACSEYYPNIGSYDYTHGLPEISNNETGNGRIPIVLYINEQSIFGLTRGVGAFEDTTKSGVNDAINAMRVTQSPFYVFAFRDSVYLDSDKPELKTEPDLRYWVYAKNHIANPNRSLVDSVNNFNCLLDGEDYYRGLKTHVNSGELAPYYEGKDYRNDALKTYKRFYFSPVNTKVPYNFFAYHIDDITISDSIRQADRVAYKIEIDGTQDLMCGMSYNLREQIKLAESKTAEAQKSIIYQTWKSLMDNAKKAKNDSVIKAVMDTIRTIGGYCSYASQYNIHPTIDIEHKLARLKFECIPAHHNAKGIKVTRVGVVSHSKGTLTVAARKRNEMGIAWDNNKDTLTLKKIIVDTVYSKSKETDPTKVDTTYVLKSQKMAPTKIEYYTNDDDAIKNKNWDKSTVTPLGSSLMVVPDDSYVLRMDFEMTGSDGSKKTGYTEVPLKLQDDPKTGPRPFIAGNEYTITVMVYGLQEIQTIVRIPSWKQGGKVLIDPDDGETEIYY